jgi:hypothetical protein
MDDRTWGDRLSRPIARWPSAVPRAGWRPEDRRPHDRGGRSSSRSRQRCLDDRARRLRRAGAWRRMTSGPRERLVLGARGVRGRRDRGGPGGVRQAGQVAVLVLRLVHNEAPPAAPAAPATRPGGDRGPEDRSPDPLRARPDRPARDVPGRSSCRGRSTTRRSSSSARTRSSSRSTASGTRRWAPPMASVFKPGHDWFFFYYRDRGALCALGSLRTRCSSRRSGARTSPRVVRGRCPRTSPRRSLHIANTSSPTGTQFLQACGCAEAGPLRRGRCRTVRRSLRVRRGRRRDDGRRDDERGRVLGVDQHGVQPEAPVVYVVEDNGYAISVPVRSTRPGAASRPARVVSEPADPRGGRVRPDRDRRGVPRAAAPRARPPGAGARARARHPSVQPLALGRRDALQDAKERESEAKRDPVRRSARRWCARGSSSGGA